MILSLFVLISTSFSSCSSQNQSIIKRIDKTPFSETVYGVWIDEEGNHLDTVSIERVKRGENNNLLYTELDESNEEEINTTKKYYRKNEDLFYSDVNYKKDQLTIRTLYETFVDRSENVIKACTRTFKNKDTIIINMFFERTEYPSGKRKQTKIVCSIDTLHMNSFIQYNEKEQKIFEYTITQNDTIEHTTYSYKSDKLFSKTKENNTSGTKAISLYDQDENEVSIKTYNITDDEARLVEERNYTYDKGGYNIAEEVLDLENNWTTKFKYIRKPLE